MSKLIMLCGLPASGKSTLSLDLAEKENAVVVSSDIMREELFNDVNNQDNNVDLFEKMHKRINKLLSEGKNVIYDATNINRKRRIHLINNELKADEYVAYYMNTPFNNCLLNDSNRARTVGRDVIDNMYKTLHIPTKLEGWDDVVFINGMEKGDSVSKQSFEDCFNIQDISHDDLFYNLEKIVEEFDDVYNVPHDSSYHSFSISRHIYHTFKYAQEEYKGERRMELLVAALFHDVGKGHCKSFYNFKGEEKRYASFIGHENVSAQLAAIYLTRMGYEDEFIKYVVVLIQFHMMPMDISEKQEKKLKGWITEEQYEDLMFLHEADLSAK